MRLAYLILAHDNPLQVTRLINTLTHANSHIFLHVDKKSKIDHFPQQADNVSIIKDRVVVKWGCFGMVEATLNLIKEAVSFGHFDHYILLSGSSYPLVNNDDIFDFFSRNDGCEYINLFDMPSINKPLSRIEYFYSKDGLLRYLFPLLSKVMEICNIKRKFPKEYSWIKPYAGSQWWALSGPCIRYILRFVRENPEFVNFFRRTWIPDEMFFHMIIGNSSFKKQVKPTLMYVDWIFCRWTPAVLSKEHFQIIKSIILTSHDNEKILFARKLQDKKTEIVDLIDEHFLKKQKISSNNLVKGGKQEELQKITSPRSKYLVFTSAGDNSNLHHWLRGHRNFDLWITYYGDQGSRFMDIADFYNIRKGCKFPNFHHVYETWKHIVDHYAAILIMDDDIIISGSDISRMFEVRERYDLWLCQPAFDPRGKISHGITEAKPFNSFRYTNFVEVTCPLFRKDKLDAFMKVFDPGMLIEYGIDWWFLDSLGHDLKGKIAVVDAIPCINPLDVAKGGQSEIDKYADEETRIRLWQDFKIQYNIQSEKNGYVEFGSIKVMATSHFMHVLRTSLLMIFVKSLRILSQIMVQIRRSRFHVNLYRLPFHLMMEVLLSKIKIFFGFVLDSREKYLNQLFDVLINLNCICRKEDAINMTVQLQPDIEITLDHRADGLGVIKRLWKQWAMVNLILQKQKIEKISDFKIMTTGLDTDCSTLDLRNIFPNSEIVVLKQDEIKAEGIIKLMKDQGWDGIDLFKADKEGVGLYLLKDEKVANDFLSKIKFIAIHIQDESDVRDSIYRILGNNRFDFSTKNGLTMGYNREHLFELR